MPPVSVDMNQMHQAFLNICNNACDVMPRGGTLTIESRKAGPDECGLETNLDKFGGCCHIRISDTGPGVPPEILPKIFDPFFTTKERGKGTGLGLSVTLGIIQNHGGCISLQNRRGGGAVVDVFLPFSAEPETYGEQTADGEIPRGTETILVVDDEKSVLEMAEKILKKAGYSVLVAEGGKEAVEIFEKHSREINLVVLDMIMPDISAIEVNKSLKEITPDMKVILSSGHMIDGQAREMISDGILGFVQKPYSISELCNAVRNALDN